MTVLLIASSMTLVFGIALIARRANIIWPATGRGPHPGKLIGRVYRPADSGQPGHRVPVRRTAPRSDRRLLMQSRSLH